MALITRARVSLGLGAKRKKGPTVDENGASLQLAEILVGLLRWSYINSAMFCGR